MANYLKKFVLSENNIRNTDLENAITRISTETLPIAFNFKTFIDELILNLQDADSSLYININNQFLNLCFIKKLPNETALYMKAEGLATGLIEGRVAATFVVYNTQTLFGAFTQHDKSLRLYEINQLFSRIVKTNGYTCNKQDVFLEVTNRINAEYYIRHHMQQVKKIILELEPNESPINVNNFPYLVNQNVKYLHEIDLSVFKDDIAQFITDLNRIGRWDKVLKIFGRSNQGGDRMITLDNSIRIIPNSFDNARCITDLSNLARNNPLLNDFQDLPIFQQLQAMTHVNRQTLL